VLFWKINKAVANATAHWIELKSEDLSLKKVYQNMKTYTNDKNQ
jgi:hypothetical protein